MEQSKKWTLNKTDLLKIGKVLMRGALYSIVIGLSANLSSLELPAQYAFLLPIASTLLTSLSYTLKKLAQ